MKKTILILIMMWAGMVSAQIGSNPSNFSNGIKLPNATNEGDTLTVDTKIPIFNDDNVLNYYADLGDLGDLVGVPRDSLIVQDPNSFGTLYTYWIGTEAQMDALILIDPNYFDNVLWFCTDCTEVVEVDWGNINGTLSNQTDLQDALDLKLNASSYTAADVLSKLLTVDGSGSGLDADLLRGVHWGNVNTDILTTGSGTFGGIGINGTVSTDTGGITAANSWKIGKNAQGTYLNLVNSSGGTTNAILRSYEAGGVQLVLAEGGITANGTVTATNFILSSDKRLKENFVDLGNGYYSFNFKGSKEKRYGVIAQEVKEYAPELVSEGEDGYLKVAYIDLLIKKIAELEARVKQLEKK